MKIKKRINEDVIIESKYIILEIDDDSYIRITETKEGFNVNCHFFNGRLAILANASNDFDIVNIKN